MERVPPAPENVTLVRDGFAAVFIAACLYDLALGVGVVGIFLLGMALYESALGRVPLTSWLWKTSGYMKGPAAMALVVGTIFVAAIFILAPHLVIRLLAEADGLPVVTEYATLDERVGKCPLGQPFWGKSRRRAGRRHQHLDAKRVRSTA